MGPQQNGPSIGYGPLPGGYQNNFNPNASSNRKKFAILFVVGAVILVMLFAITLLGNRKDPAKEHLIDLVVAETELLRISEDVEKNLADPATRRHHADLTASLTTNSALLRAELKRAYKVKSIPSGRQKAAVDKQANELLASALKLNHLDKDYAEIASEKLASQVELAQKAQGITKSQKTKTVLTDVANHTEELRKRFEADAKDTTITPVPQTPSQ